MSENHWSVRPLLIPNAPLDLADTYREIRATLEARDAVARLTTAPVPQGNRGFDGVRPAE